MFVYVHDIFTLLRPETPLKGTWANSEVQMKCRIAVSALFAKTNSIFRERNTSEIVTFSP